MDKLIVVLHHPPQNSTCLFHVSAYYHDHEPAMLNYLLLVLILLHFDKIELLILLSILDCT